MFAIEIHSVGLWRVKYEYIIRTWLTFSTFYYYYYYFPSLTLSLAIDVCNTGAMMDGARWWVVEEAHLLEYHILKGEEKKKRIYYVYTT